MSIVPDNENNPKFNCLQIGGEVETNRIQNAELVVDNNNNPQPENALTERNNADSKCTYQEWGHSGICYRKNAVSNTKSSTIESRRL